MLMLSPAFAQQEAEFAEALKAARGALQARHPGEARRQLERAEKSAASPGERDQVRQLRSLAEQVALFLDAVQRGLKKYQATEEITIDGMAMAIVEVFPDRVTLFIEGARRSYTIAAMPANVALFFARSAADEDDPAAAVFFGAFYAVEGDRGRARALWQAAGAAGAPVEDLLPLVARAPAATKHPAAPEAKQLAAARQAVQQRFDEAIVAAKTPAQKAQFAASLLEAGRAMDDAAEQYAAFEQARDWAVAGGDPATALLAIDALGESFGADKLELKSKALGASIAGRITAQSAAAAAAAAIGLSVEAQRASRAELALSLADTAYAAARKARDSALVKQAYARRSEAQEQLKSSPSGKAKPRAAR
jgi:hypothetical protein